MIAFKPAAVFFDLDGTLADTAGDLAAPIHQLRKDRGLPPIDEALLRPYTSRGARGLIGRGLGITPEDPGSEALRQDFLARYERAMLVRTVLFDGMSSVLDHLESAGIRWGVISNKSERYVRPILAGLGLLDRSVCAIGGDTTPFAKPHPEPLFEGARQAAVDPQQCIYVGDDRRDIEAGHAAGMVTVAASYGYCGDAAPPTDWGAHYLIEHPHAFLDLLDSTRR
jgi:phosphoglycolate phosphatase